MDKRYQVFISSTYVDLKDERRAVMQAVLELDCIPAGMELFPAVDEEQFTFIKRIIDDCDYYLLIIGGRYGSTTPEGISYTEQEYDYAVSKGIKVISLVHEDPELIPFGKSEVDPALRERLQRFRAKAMQNRLAKTWKISSDLPALVLSSLNKTIKLHPAVGWVRGNAAASVEILSEVNELRKQNAALREGLAAIVTPASITDLADLDEKVTFHGSCKYHRHPYTPDRWEATVTWRSVFAAISPYLLKYPIDSAVKKIIEKALFEESGSQRSYNLVDMDDQEFQTISIQFKALGLVKLNYTETTAGGYGMFWNPTLKAEQLLLELRTIRRQSGKADAQSQ